MLDFFLTIVYKMFKKVSYEKHYTPFCATTYFR